MIKVRKKKRIWKIWGKVFKIRVFPLKTRKPSFLRDAPVSSARRADIRGYTGFSKFMLRDAWKCRRDASLSEDFPCLLNIPARRVVMYHASRRCPRLHWLFKIHSARRVERSARRVTIRGFPLLAEVFPCFLRGA